jgi:hypothetical protein
MTEFILTISLIATGAFGLYTLDKNRKRLAVVMAVICASLATAYCILSTSGWEWIILRLILIALTAFMAGTPDRETKGEKSIFEEDPLLLINPLALTNDDPAEKFFAVLILLCFIGCTYCPPPF